MQTFTDSEKRTWNLTLNLGVAKTIMDRLEINLLQPEEGETPVLTRLGTDEMLLGEVICVMLEGQFLRHNMTEEKVREVFDGETLLAAQTAFYAELELFFQTRGRRDRATATRKQAAMIDAGVRAVEQRIDAIDVQETINEVMNATPDSGVKTE